MAKKIIKAQMKQRLDTKANWASQNPVLLAGELGIVSDDPNLYKVGDGTTAWNALPFRGFDGTLVHTTGDSETAAMSQKGVTEELIQARQALIYSSLTADNSFTFGEGGFYEKTGALNPSSNYSNTGLIAVTPDVKVELHCHITGGAPVVVFLNEKREYLFDLFIIIDTSYQGVIDFSEERYKDVAYIIASNRTASIPNPICKVSGKFPAEQVFSGINSELDSINHTLADLTNNSFALSEYGYVHTGGGITQTEKAKRSDYIRIGNYKGLKWAANISPAGFAVAFFDRAKNLLPDISVLGTGALTSGDIDLTGEQYAEAEYVMLSYYDPTLNFSGYVGELYNPGSIAQVMKAEEKRSCDKTGLKVLIFGDSITTCASITYNGNKQTTSYNLRSQSNSYVDKEGNTIKFSMWPYLLTEYFNCKDVRNYAESGASYKDAVRGSGNERQNLSFQIDLAINDIYNPNGVFPTEEFRPDIVIFALGTNDGSANDTYESAMAKTVTTQEGFDIDATLANLDTSKFCEAARKAFIRVCRAFPYAQKLCVLPIQRETWEQAENGVNAELRRMAERYSIQVIDGAAESGIVRDFEVSGGVGTYLKDGLHPNDMGQLMYARMIARYIRQFIQIG